MFRGLPLNPINELKTRVLIIPLIEFFNLNSIKTEGISSVVYLPDS